MPRCCWVNKGSEESQSDHNKTLTEVSAEDLAGEFCKSFLEISFLSLSLSSIKCYGEGGGGKN